MKNQIETKIKEVIALAERLYGFDITFEELNITYHAKGKAAGYAWYKGFQGARQYGLKFSSEAASINMADMLEDTIPHEVAHLVNFALPHTGKDHNQGWKRVCIALGGTGERCYDGSKMVLTPAKISRKWLYKASCGTEVELSTKMHNQIQRGSTRSLRRTGGQIASIHLVGQITKNQMAQRIKEKQAKINGTPPVQQAARAPAPAPKKARTGTKADMAKVLIAEQQANGNTRGGIIVLLMEHLDMSKAGASTYYQKYK